MYKSRRVALWNREEHGGYKAEIEGFELEVKWRPEGEGPRGFTWEAKGPDDTKLESEHVVEEIEEAMGDAEDALRKHLHPETI